MGGTTPVSSPVVLSREVVLTKSSLAGICLITFACGVVTTVMVDRARPRVSDREVVTRDLEATPSRTAPAQDQPPAAAPGAAAPVAPPQAVAPAAPSAPAAGDPVVVQMPNLDETTELRPPLPVRSAALAAGHPHPVAAASVAKTKPVAKLAASSPAAAKTKPVAMLATSSPVAAKRKPGATLGASPPATKAKPTVPAAAGGSKKTKTTDPYGPPTEWVDPFTQ